MVIKVSPRPGKYMETMVFRGTKVECYETMFNNKSSYIAEPVLAVLEKSWTAISWGGFNLDPCFLSLPTSSFFSLGLEKPPVSLNGSSYAKKELFLFNVTHFTLLNDHISHCE